MDYEIYSKRMARQRGEFPPDFYIYNDIPDTLRIQIMYIWNDTIGDYASRFRIDSPQRYLNNAWERIQHTLAKELGVESLISFGIEKKANEKGLSDNPRDQCVALLLYERDISRVLSIIELSFQLFDSYIRKTIPELEQSVDAAIKDLNRFFGENGVGYEYQSGLIIRKDSEFLHQEVVIPAIILLHEPGFSGALKEFLDAHAFYRKNNKKQAIAEALKSFESVMKIICDQRGWEHKNATAQPLIDILIKNGLIPSELLSHFTGVRQTLEGGLPTISNKTSRHGQGTDIVEVEFYMVSYALHLCAANIVFLINANKAYKG